jgi:hypothetical protein
VGAGVGISSTGGENGVSPTGTSIFRDALKISAPAATIAIHEQQTRTATIPAIIFGVEEDGFGLVSMNIDLLRCFIHLTRNG